MKRVVLLILVLVAFCEFSRAEDDGTVQGRQYFVRGIVIGTNAHGIFLDCAPPAERHGVLANHGRWASPSIPQDVFLIGHPQKFADKELCAALATYAGLYRFQTVTGAERTVRAYKVLKAERP